VNCRIPWIIESLNAYCDLLVFQEVCLFENRDHLTSFLKWTMSFPLHLFFLKKCLILGNLKYMQALDGTPIRWTGVIKRPLGQVLIALSNHGQKVSIYVWLQCRKLKVKLTWSSVYWISNQARLPAELKHINKRRKRN